MHDFSPASGDPLRVVVAGAGVAGLEVLAGLQAVAPGGVAPALVAPGDTFSLRALGVYEAFGLDAARRYPLAELAADLGAVWHRDTVAAVDRRDHAVTLGSGARLPYDVLVLAVGARPYPAFDHGVVFDRARYPERFDALLGDVRSGRARSVAVVVPHGATWALPAYELALMLATGGTGSAPEVTIVTAEPEPLAAFGAEAGTMIRRELDGAGVRLVTGVRPRVPSARLVDLGHDHRLHVDRVVHLPLLAGPRMAGVPYDATGFIEVDDLLRVDDDPDVLAAGDGTAGAFKQGGLAAQQADVVVRTIAHRAGHGRPPRPYAPVLRAVLRTEHGPRYLRAEPPGGAGESLVSEHCLWWPPSKVATRWLTAWLATRDLQGPAQSPPRLLPGGGISRGSLSAPATTRPRV